MCAFLIYGFLSLLNYFFSLFNSVSVMSDLREIAKVLFLCLLSVWFRATANR
jgi:hypothetical protein